MCRLIFGKIKKIWGPTQIPHEGVQVLLLAHLGWGAIIVDGSLKTDDTLDTDGECGMSGKAGR